MARQQQQYMNQFSNGPGPALSMPRQQNFSMQQQMQYTPIDPYGYGMQQAQFPSVDPRYVQQYPQMMQGMGGMPAEMGIIDRYVIQQSGSC